jgi:hypothetical protein
MLQGCPKDLGGAALEIKDHNPGSAARSCPAPASRQGVAFKMLSGQGDCSLLAGTCPHPQAPLAELVCPCNHARGFRVPERVRP